MPPRVSGGSRAAQAVALRVDRAHLAQEVLPGNVNDQYTRPAATMNPAQKLAARQRALIRAAL